MTEAEAGVVWPEPRGWERQEGFSLPPELRERVHSSCTLIPGV